MDRPPRAANRALGAFFRLPTTTLEGRFFLVGLVAIGFLATATDRNFVILCLGVLLAVVLVSVVFSTLNLRKIRFSRTLPEAVEAGEPFTVRVRVANRRRWLPARGVVLKDALQAGRSGTESNCFAPTIPARGHVTFLYSARIRRRGAYNITNALLTTRYPFGLFEKRSMTGYPSRLVVYPRMQEIDPDRVPGTRHEHQALREPVLRRQRGDEFRALRDYRPGDDPRRIAWRVSARQQRLVLKELERKIRGRVGVVLATSLAGVPIRDRRGALESAVSLAASLVRHLHRMKRTCFFAAPGFSASVSRNRESLKACLEHLATVRADPRGTAEQVLAQVGAARLSDADVLVVAAGEDVGSLPRGVGCRYHPLPSLSDRARRLYRKGGHR